VIRIAITGPECTGKTSLSNWLSSQLFDTKLIREYAREYLSKKPEGYSYTASDILEIAAKNATLFSKAFQANSDALVVDTEFFVLDIWMEEVFHTSSEEIREFERVYDFDLYLLCEPDIPWEADPLRENPHDRYRLFYKYKQVLQENNRTFDIVNGIGEDRHKRVLERILRRFPNLSKKED
jgi:nicotinamide riboside kinase